MAKDNKKAITSKKEKNIKRIQTSLKVSTRKSTKKTTKSSNNKKSVSAKSDIKIIKDKPLESVVNKNDNETIKIIEKKTEIDKTPNAKGDVLPKKKKQLVNNDYRNARNNKRKKSENKSNKLNTKNEKKEITVNIEEVSPKETDETENVEKSIVSEQKDVELERIEKTVKIRRINGKTKKYNTVVIKNVPKKESQAKETIDSEKEKKFADDSEGVTEKFVRLGDTLIINIQEKASDNNIPTGDSKEEKKKRIKRYLLEALVYAVIITLINLFAIEFFPYPNYIKLFDVKWANISLTIILSLIFSYLLAFFIDCLVSEIIFKKKNKTQEEGVHDGSSRFKRKKHQEDIEN